MATHEELAALFSRNLNLDNNPYVALEDKPAPAPEPITYSISQHYHHSSHVPAQQLSRPASEPPQTDQLTAEIILARHGVDVASLFPSQLDLFKTAEPSQQMRLVELWRICPPEYTGHELAHDLGNWPTTSVEQEETMARLRYEQQMTEERMSRVGGDQQSMSSDTMSDSSTTAPLTPIQGGDGRWSGSLQPAEPYMTSGYEQLAQREYERTAGPSKDIYSHFGTAIGGPSYNQSTDPVYKSVGDNVGGDWEKLLQHRQVAMENQYGAFQQNFQGNIGGVVISTCGHNEDEEML